MNRKLLSLLFIIIALVSCAQHPVTLEERLATLNATSIDSIRADTLFESAWEIHLVQPVDHNNPDGPAFSQRIYLSYAGADRPVVLVTEGYGANRNYTTELARYLDCNQIIVEHRYFGESVPDSIDWRYMNTFQAASDHHRVIELFSTVFTGDWITTGISKGGQAVMFHSYYYPEDADIRVPYVAPLNFGPEDPRIYIFLDTVSDEYCRDRVYQAQVEILKNRDTYYPMFLEMSNKLHYTFGRVGGPEVAFEMSVLEFDFAFWQWGRTSCEDIVLGGTPIELFDQFFRISGPDYFSDQGIAADEPFFYQALTEIGFYGYRFEKFGDLLHYAKDGDSPDFAFASPCELPEYDYSFGESVNNYVEDADHFIFIYGMQDTWSATAVQLSGKGNSLKILKQGGDHLSRINNLDEKDRELVLKTLHSWLKN